MKITLVDKKVEAKGTVSFFWQPEKEVKFQPGQYFYYTLPSLKYPDARGATRHFTIASSPTEGQILMLTTRIREESGYKKTLNELPVGTTIEGEGPEGTFILEDKEPGLQVFIAGGIGITPFRCMIKYVTDKNLEIPVYLIFSNSDSEFVYKKELDEIASKNPNIKIRYVDSSKEGHLDELKIAEFIENWELGIGNCNFWLVGPPPMIDAMEEVMAKMKIPENRIRSEKFTGY